MFYTNNVPYFSRETVSNFYLNSLFVFLWQGLPCFFFTNYCILIKVCYTIVMVMLMRHLVRLAVTLCLFALPPLY